MNDEILRVDHLSKTFDKVSALEEVSLTIEKGRIYGFIGKNGAGKTTLMRIITGLSYPSKGKISLFGESSLKGLLIGRTRIGCMIEHAALYPNLTAFQNLELYRKLKDIDDKSAINQLLNIVGLEDAGRKKFRDFSMGMKQRLGIASALMGNPDLLILDEPINGLDPLGIIEIRELLKKLNQEFGMTILISSHILSELYMLASDFIIIDEGKIVSTLTLQELDEQCKKRIHIKVENVKVAEAILKRLNIHNYTYSSNNRFDITDEAATLESIAKAFFDDGILLTELSCSTKSLESFFVELVEGEQNV